MGAKLPTKEEIFNTAAEIADAGGRTADPLQACGNDLALRAEIEELLDHDRSDDSLLDRSVPGIGATFDQPVAERPGTVIGPYKLLQQIGEGGMGVVFMAEQTEPIQRTVALKIIKPGMDTRQVIARFEAERQALAMMDHPNIARVLDAGVVGQAFQPDVHPEQRPSQAGKPDLLSARPYFVMDLVKGVPITDYCDAQHLTVRQRLELFTQVCHAVQHAHQKGIIHRDLKPSNVLVAEYDGKPVPKVIDFGVAKATAQRLTERTMFTQYGQIVGTFEYMSPEQARFNQLDVDTRSDIYSLGVLLYELLAGSTPLEKERLRTAAFDEILRLISEEEPPRPSTRISSSGSLPLAGRVREGVSDSATIAANRQSEPAKLSKELSGELDWIVMKCLEKDRNRRYETATGLGRDIDRYLQDEPVEACPPSAAYRFRKFARRNKAAMLAASSSVLVLLLVMIGLTISNRLIAAERQRAEQNFLRARLAVSKILSQAGMGVGDWAKLPPELRKKFANEAITFYESFLQEESADPALQYETAVSYRALSELYRSIGEMQPAEKLVRQSIANLEQLTSKHSDSPDYRQQLAYSHYTLGQLLRQTKRSTEAAPNYARAAGLYEDLISQRRDVADYFTELAPCYGMLAYIQKNRGATEQAEQTIQRLLDLSSKVPDSEKAADIQFNIGIALRDCGRFSEAVTVYREVIHLRPDNAWTHFSLGYALGRQDKIDEAIEAYREAVRLSPNYRDAHFNLANHLASVGRTDEAITHERKAIEIDPKYKIAYVNLGFDLYSQHKFDEAAAVFRTAKELDPDYFLAYFGLVVRPREAVE